MHRLIPVDPKIAEHRVRIDKHCHALALYFVWYNFVRIHKTLRTSPAMAAGVTDRLWEMKDIVALIDANEPETRKRGPYKISTR